MKDFKGGKRFGGDRGGFGGKPSFNRGDRGDRGDAPMFKATCASCGKPCEVPFRPSGDRPVYCRDCFAKNAPQGGDRFAKKDFAPRAPFKPREDAGSADVRRTLETIVTKLDKLISVMERNARPAEVVTEAQSSKKFVKKEQVVDTKSVGKAVKKALKTKTAKKKK